MVLSIWRNIGFGVTDFPLSETVLANLKRELPEDWHALKYIVFPIKRKSEGACSSFFLDESLAMLDWAKRYNLNKFEFENACKAFVSAKINTEPISAMKRKVNSRFVKRKKPQLPNPKIGQVLWRKDPRRGGACKIIKIDEQRTTVYWPQTKRHTTILNSNIRNPLLFSHSSS